MVETRSKKRKRQRLITISSNVSSWPNVPARFESLNDDTLTTVLQFVGKKSYRSFGGLNYHCKEIYLSTPGMTKETFIFGYAPLAVIQDRIEKKLKDNNEEDDDEWETDDGVGEGVVLYNRLDVFDWALQEKKKDVLQQICNVAAREGRIEILVKVWNNMINEDEKEDIISDVDFYAAYGGKLEVLKWIETWLKDKGLSINKYNMCTESAAEGGHIHILQWLKEEKGFELDGELYCSAAWGGHLHVMKWLRKQEVDWDEDTFPYAAQKGNLDILQWLHDEGCPFPEDDDDDDDEYRVNEEDLKSEVLDWLRENGYGDRV